MSYFNKRLRFYTFHHPYVCTFIEGLTRVGVDGLISLDNQGLEGETPPPPYTMWNGFFVHRYNPHYGVVDLGERKKPVYNVDFDIHGAYAQYNWELFFHIPLFIATKLMQDQQYDEAMKWFHYIFNPTTDSPDAAPKRYWFFKPFRDLGKPEAIKVMMQRLIDPGLQSDDIVTAIKNWRKYPFDPHRIARRRPGAYEKTVVMKYCDLHLACGDQLFSRDTIESINEAAQHYILVARMLGPRAQVVTGQPNPLPKTYAELRSSLDVFSNAMVAMENVSGPWLPSPGVGGGQGPPPASGLYFCIPHNEKLMGYWDTVEDRLFKIRNCMNIEGVVRQLPLFEPPIDPALLVRARALGLDLASVLDDLSAPLPHYRFSFTLQKAREFCEELKQLGGLVLSALEKKDAEKLAQTRAGHEKALLESVREVKKQQIKDAENTLAGLEKAKELADARAAHYKAVSGQLPGETQFMSKQAEALRWQLASQEAALQGSEAAAVPEITVTVGMGSGISTQVGSGKAIALIANLMSTHLGWLGQIATVEGTTASYKAQLTRAQQDRSLQINLATIESQQLDKQIVAADIRRQIAENELANHEKQIDQSGEIEDFLREKFTNQDLYTWMVSQVSAVYFQAYKLAYDMAKRAERLYRYELGIDDSAFIQFGAWDNLRKGLLAGERLSLDLRRLEQAYLTNNRREHEVTKHVSLALLDPGELLKLRETGTCEFSMPELLFDLDFPDHYFRRIKSVRLTIPCVAGPYTSVNAKLTLLKNRIRKNAKDSTTNYAYQPDDGRFLENLVGIQSIATSSAQGDAGLFELNFRDERFLPFEGAGVISTWRLELPTAYRHFDYDTISDAIVHVSYTARDGGDAFKAVVSEHVEATINKWLDELADSGAGLPRLFSLRQEFPNTFYRFMNPLPGSPQSAEFEITKQHFPYFLSEKTLQLTGVTVYLKPKTKDSSIDPSGFGLNDVPPTGTWKLHFDGSLLAGEFVLTNSPIKKWAIKVGLPGLDKEQLEDILLLLRYTIS